MICGRICLLLGRIRSVSTWMLHEIPKHWAESFVIQVYPNVATLRYLNLLGIMMSLHQNTKLF